ncbi:MAG TPA: FHA domain-containing protein [Actinoallomurus sp.]|nr:FHA domain-containing protein [Actinoallomurus sp.]
MATCPAGHTSGADDYCDVCGARITGAPSVPASTGAPSGGPDPAGGTAGESCPDCAAPRTGRFCEGCGYDFAIGAGRPAATGPIRTAASGGSVPSTPPVSSAPSVPAGADLDEDAVTGPFRGTPAPPAAGWTAVVAADRDYYEAVLRQSEENGAFPFPPYCPERRIPLAGPQVRIGRRSVSQGTVPEIDLSEPPEDPGASHTHAVLLARPDGTWSLVDPGSTNGTTVNGGDDPIPVNVEVPMRDGDRIHIGVWTTITLRRG